MVGDMGDLVGIVLGVGGAQLACLPRSYSLLESGSVKVMSVEGGV